jgi:hypothetical protein
VNKRDKALIEKVGYYYLQYKGVVDVEKLLQILDLSQELRVSNEVLNYIHYYILYLITRDSVKSANKALKDRLTYREFSVEYSQELYGQLDVARTIMVYPLIAYYDFKEGYNAPEYGILGYLLRRIYEIVSEKREGIKIIEPHPYFNFLKDFERLFSELNSVKDIFPEGYYRDPSYTDPPWLIRAYKAYVLAKKLEDIRIGGGGEKADKELIKFLKWKLYELYVFYLVVTYLWRNKYEIVKEDEQRYYAIKGNKKIKFIFNASLSNSTLRRVDDLEDIDKYKGRPDLSLVEEKPIIFECKYSQKVGYITMGRFKVMAYTYEYQPLVSVLVYPGLDKEGIDYDAEDSATRELDRRAKERGLIDFWYNSHLIYMAIIDPLRDDNKYNLKIIEEILKEFV